MEDQQKNIERIQELVIDERYREAFEALPGEVRQMVLTVQAQVRETMGDVFKTDSDKYKLEIIDALGAHEMQRAATLLAAHPDNFVPTAPASSAVKPQKPQAPAVHAAPSKPPPTPRPKEQTPPYHLRSHEDRSFFDVENAMIFPAHCERLAAEVFRGENPHLKAWLKRMEGDFQVPYSPKIFDELVWEKVRRTKAKAEMKLRSRPPLPLNYAESNAYYHTNHYFEEMQAEAMHHLQNKSFSHLVEYVIVELLNLIKDKMDPSLKRVMKSAPEEDLFCGCDIVVEDNYSRWYSVDLTTSPRQAEEKRQRGMHRHTDHLPSLQEMLLREGELEAHERLNAIPIIQLVDRDLARVITERHITSIKNGENKPLLQIFREAARQLGKNDDQASRELLDLAS